VSATAGNKRYYGLLIDQPSLKEATSLWLQDQTDSLELNKRIRLLQPNQQGQNGDQVMTTEGQAENHVGTTSQSNVFHSQQSLDNETIRKETDSKEVGTYPPTFRAEMGESSENGNGANPKGAISSLGETRVESSAEKIMHSNSTIHSTEIDIHTSGEEPVSQTNDSPLPSSLGPPKREEKRIDTTSTTTALLEGNDRPVQKFKYVHGTRSNDPGYRVLVATFVNVEEAANGDRAVAKKIQNACEEGGNYLPGESFYYYQYEVLPAVLTSTESEKSSDYGLRTSLGLHMFLQSTQLPPWFPLSNLQTRQGKVLNLLNMKKDSNGNSAWNDSGVSGESAAASLLGGGTRITMQPRPRPRYQIGVVGGGIAGVACCRELVTRLENENIEYHITLLEARSRLGGRLWTDSTYQSDENGTIPIELGASWIHGIDDNPLAALAREAGINFVTASEEVQMLGEGMRRIDSKLDEGAGKFFDDLLDLAADDCWSTPETVVKSECNEGQDPQAVVRWYSSVFASEDDGTKTEDDKSSGVVKPPRIPAPSHRHSSDRSIDVEMGKALLKHKLRYMSKRSTDEHRMLLWNTKNVEYALGANISDLSMKYWDADERT